MSEDTVEMQQMEDGSYGCKVDYITIDTPIEPITKTLEAQGVKDPWDNYIGELEIQPPIALSTLYNLALQSPTIQACAASLASNIIGNGCDIIPKSKRSPDFAAKQIDAFMAICGGGGSFSEARYQQWQDVGLAGNGGIEMCYTADGNRIAAMEYIPFHDIRISTLYTDEMPLVRQQYIHPKTGASVERVFRRKFHLYVQRVGDRTIYFKEHGDPRNFTNSGEKLYRYDHMTGEVENFDTINPNTANGIWHVKWPCPFSYYGLPPWYAAIPYVLGARKAAELNYGRLSVGYVPPLAVLVNGGQLTPGSVTKLTDYFRNVRLTNGMSDKPVVTLELTPFGNRGPFQGTGGSIEIKPLSEMLPDDAMFTKYLEICDKEVRLGFRIAAELLAEKTVNSSDASEVSRQQAEEQVFRRIRNEQDIYITNTILPYIGDKAELFTFKSRAPRPSNHVDRSSAFFSGQRGLAATPNHQRQVTADLLGEDVPEFNPTWGDVPAELTKDAVNIALKNYFDGKQPIEIRTKAAEYLSDVFNMKFVAPKVKPAEPKQIAGKPKAASVAVNTNAQTTDAGNEENLG